MLPTTEDRSNNQSPTGTSPRHSGNSVRFQFTRTMAEAQTRHRTNFLALVGTDAFWTRSMPATDSGSPPSPAFPRDLCDLLPSRQRSSDALLCHFKQIDGQTGPGPAARLG
jgi:hypothetical protein